MVPVLLMQVIFVPIAASWMMDYWAIKRRETALADVGSHLGSTIVQLYFSLSRAEIAAGTAFQSAQVPPFIENIPYVVVASDRKVENSTFVDLNLALMGTSTSAEARVVLGPNVLWQHATFLSNATSAGIEAEKFPNGTLSFSFRS
jgi:hypothetical protein